MSFDRQDFYDECESYCQNCKLLNTLDDMLFDCDYNENDKSSVLQLKSFVLRQIEYFEKRRIGRTLKGDVE